MKRNIRLTLFLSILALASFSQPTAIRLANNLRLPGDSVFQQQFLSVLTDFWRLKDSVDVANPLIDSGQLLATSALLDEVRGVQAGDGYKGFYNPYLTNVVALSDGTFVLQFALAGVANNQPTNRLVFELRARRTPDGFHFYSPLQQNTLAWKMKTAGGFTFHYPVSLPEKVVSDYVRLAASFDKKLQAASQRTDIFIAGNFPEVLRLLGIAYEAGYEGYAYTTLNARQSGQLLLVNGEEKFDDFDPHDLWQERLRNVYASGMIYKPVDEGCAYLYGGSWGIRWEDILERFKQKVVKPDADYLSLYEGMQNFGESQQKHLIAGYVMNALLVRKIEKEKGFAAVKELLTCGKYQKDNANYFLVLERLTGINRANFNQRMAELIQQS